MQDSAQTWPLDFKNSLGEEVKFATALGREVGPHGVGMRKGMGGPENSWALEAWKDEHSGKGHHAAQSYKDWNHWS